MLLRDSKLNYLLIGLFIFALSMPLINIFIIYPQFNRLLLNDIEDTAVRLADHLNAETTQSGIWTHAIDEPQAYEKLAALLQKETSGFQLHKIKVFAASGIAIYSTEAADIGTHNTHDYFHNIVATGSIFSELVKKETQSLEGQTYQADVVEVYVPVMRDGEFIGAYELYYNITERVDALDRVILFASLLPVVVTGVLFLTLVWGLKVLDRGIAARKRVEQELHQALAVSKRMAVELEKKNQLLDQSNRDLKATQSQMLQREKMASIGQLAAGVAHEINNPTGFVISNIRTMQNYLATLTERMAQEYGVLTKHLPAPERDALIQQRATAGIEAMLEDADDLLSESLEGAIRIKDIVQNLKSFSHVDKAELSECDINECLESTLKIIWNELKYNVTLKKAYGQLPPVFCYPHQLSQVFMNILINASHAIAEQGVIEIKTWSAHDQVFIAIRDNGCGIPKEIQHRITEPFFTTKDVGKGTGLGMSIAYDIITKHQGRIDLDSVLGEGTTFTISLPVRAVGVA